MNSICLVGAACVLAKLHAHHMDWGPLLTQVVFFAETVLLLLICIPLGALGVYGVVRAGTLVAQARDARAARQAHARRMRAQQIAELEVMGGHGVVKDGTCPVCLAPLVVGANYCSTCGKRQGNDDVTQVVVCPTCYVANPAAGRYCSECGKPLRSALH